MFQSLIACPRGCYMYIARFHKYAHSSMICSSSLPAMFFDTDILITVAATTTVKLIRPRVTRKKKKNQIKSPWLLKLCIKWLRHCSSLPKNPMQLQKKLSIVLIFNLFYIYSYEFFLDTESIYTDKIPTFWS